MKLRRGSRRDGTAGSIAGTAYDEHDEQSRRAQRDADKWLIAGTALMGTLVLGVIGFPIFMRGVVLQRRAQQSGLSVRPIMVTLIGYLVLLDAAMNSFGWALDFFANHTLISRVFLTAWGNMLDGGYFWHYNELWVGGAGGPGEKGWQVAQMVFLFPARIAAALGLLQMKRWGQQWLLVTCWIGVFAWIGYTVNMTIYADIRFDGVVFPVVGWWVFNIFFITPFLAIPYLHTVNREIFID